ncbi:MAG: hypothetical protein RIA69_13895 [Cyclobacteriaceae bacterium]
MSSYKKTLMCTAFVLLSALLLTSCGVGSTSELNNSFFITVDPSMSDDLSSLMKEKLAMAKGQDVVINFEKGEYHFYPEQAKSEYLTISNNDNGDKKIAMPFFGVNSVRIEGNGSDLIFHGGIIPLVLKGVGESLISDVNIYWDKPFTFEGEVIESSQENGTFTLKVEEQNEYEIRKGRLFFKGYDWELPLGENIVYSKETLRPYYFTSHYEHPWLAQELTAEELSEGIVKFGNVKAKKVPPVGSIWVDKGPHGENRRYPAIFINDSKNIRIERVNVYASGAMALIAEKSSNITLSKYNVTLPEGSKRMIGVTADATHFVNCKGLISMDSCLFKNILDDATNVQGTYMLVDEVVDANTLKASFGHYQQEGFPFASEGDSIRFVSRGDLLPIKVVTVKSVKMDSENDYKIAFNQDISDLDLVNTVAENISFVAAVKITNCVVKQNRARSLLISTSKPVEISNNYFSSMMAGIRICGDANFWFESGPVSDVLIKGNVFEDLGIGGHNPQAILQIDPIIGKEFRSNGFYHRNISFTGNTIKTFDRLLVYALSVDGLSITDNKISQTHGYKEIYPDLSHFDIQNCNNVFISGNEYVGTSDAEISLKLSDQFQINDQLGFSPKIVNNPNKYFYQN